MASHSNPDLEARMLGNPDDRDAFAVYGDWLSERGDPRGELIAVQIKREQHPDDADLRAREQALLEANRAAWLGELAELDPTSDVHVTWRWGFVDAVRIGPDTNEYETSDADFPDAIAKLARIPFYDHVRAIVVGAFNHDDWPTSWGPSIEALAKAGTPAALRSLEFHRGGFWDISSTELGDLSPLYPRLGKLRRLYIELGSMSFGAMDLPALEHLEIVTGGLQGDNVASIVNARWPRLEKLLLHVGQTGNDYGCNVEMSDLEPIFVAENLPRVKHLALANSSLADLIAAGLVKSRILPRLQTLDLSKGTMSDDGARQIIDHWSAFSHLEKLDLSHGYFSDGVLAELQALGGGRLVLGDLQPSDDDYRYCEIGE